MDEKVATSGPLLLTYIKKCVKLFACFFCCLLIFFKINLFNKNFFGEYNQSVKRFESRSGLTFFWALTFPWVLFGSGDQ